MKIAALLLAAAALPASAATFEFRALLDGEPIGYHRFSVERAANEVRVMSEARFSVRILFVEAWRYEHRAEERWRGGCLVSLESRTETNGAREAVRAWEQEARLVVERDGLRETLGPCEMSFAYWNPAILAATRLLNSQTGAATQVRVLALGDDAFPRGGHAVKARRYRIEGRGLVIDLWYRDGEWIGLESRLEGGRRLRYEIA